MYLSEQDASMFYKTWLGLLEFINQMHQIVPGLTDMKNATSLNPQEVYQIRNKLWEDENLIDEYLQQYGSALSTRETELIRSWKNKLAGKFIICKHLKKYSVFMDTEKGGNLYGVLGISNPIEDMFPSERLPIYVDAVLIPFEGKIIYDSFLLPYNMSFGSGIKKGLKEDYRYKKEKHGIITSLA